MPIASGRKGKSLAIVRPRATAAIGAMGARVYRSPALAMSNPVLTGITRDASGTPLAGCTVQLFRTADDQIMFETVSDGAGAYTLTALGSGPFYVVAYKAGAPDVAGTTVNTLSAD